MPKAAANPLAKYWAKRDFSATSEPRGERARTSKALSFVIQKHAATRLHYDFRLELDGVLVSWAVPKGPSYDPSVKRMAIHVEDHPLSYGSFEGTIPAKQYGAGSVIVWDNGTWQPIGDPHEGLAKGKLLFAMHGQKMAGQWELIKIAKGGEKQEPWLLFKKRDAFARPQGEYDVVTALPDSVISKPLARPASAGETETRTRGKSAGAAKKRAAQEPDIPGAMKAPLPQKLSPQLATLTTGVPSAGEWLYEIKFDGYRIMTRCEDGKTALITRGGHDWSAKLPGLVRELKTLAIRSGWLDGEVVVLGEDGAPDFNALQNAFDRRNSAGITYFLFDVPFFEGYDLREVQLRHRRQLLEVLLKEKATEHVRFSDAFEADPAALLASACGMGLEGIIAKRTDAKYVSRRTDTWLKLKCKQRQEFVVCGYTERAGASPHIGSLQLGLYSEGELVPVGSVGTGWDSEEAVALKVKLAKIARDTAPFPAGPKKPGRWTRRSAADERWVEPRLVAEVEFSDWTPEGQIRHASYIALRRDKPAKSITRETATTLATLARSAAGSTVGTKVTHGERVIDPTTGLTKLQLVRYYESVSDWILPHLKGRPCSLVRGPKGVTGKLFFQRHGEKIGIPGITELDASLWPGHVSMPVAWEALPKIKSGTLWTILNAREYLSFQTNDPWAGYWKKKQTLAAAMKTLRFSLSKARA